MVHGNLKVTVLIDAENVRRSAWPNIAPDELVNLVRAWAEGERVRPVVVFDGSTPGGLVGEREDDRVLVVGTGGETADDWIAREAPRFRPYWLVTSDRELRGRTKPERLIGGGRFVREISAR
jgi:predicted RNA-binding protein with PIN domain